MEDLKEDPKVVDRLLDVSMRIAEGQGNTFHCITPDCTYWWYLEPEQANDIIYCNVIRLQENFMDINLKTVVILFMFYFIGL